MMTLLGLSLFPLGLTIAMFVTRNMMLGFPSAIFWGVLGGYAYQQSSATWDWQYTLFFAAMGMVIFSIFSAYALRNKDLAGPDADRVRYIDEGGSKRRVASTRDTTEGSEGEHKGDDSFTRPWKSREQRREEREKNRKGKVKRGEFD
jgi:hypothetical protein